MREELLNTGIFANMKEAKVLAEDCRDYYNHHRPHGALGYLTPKEFAATKALKASEPFEQLESISKTLIVSGTENGVRSAGYESILGGKGDLCTAKSDSRLPTPWRMLGGRS
jgi:hypothetical protein